MSFYVSLSGLKGAQADLSAISNNVANVNSTAFKKSKAQFGDIFAASPMKCYKNSVISFNFLNISIRGIKSFDFNT